MDIGKRITQLRISRKLNQVQLANILNVSPSTIAMWETNKRSLTPKSINSLSNFFQVSTDYILNGKLYNDETETISFYKNLRTLRKNKKHLTQLDMAKYLNIAKTTYASYEQGKRMPDINIQKQLADYFGVTLDYLHGMDSKNVKLTSNQLKILSHIDDGITEEQVKEISNFIEFVKQKNTNVN